MNFLNMVPENGIVTSMLFTVFCILAILDNRPKIIEQVRWAAGTLSGMYILANWINDPAGLQIDTIYMASVSLMTVYFLICGYPRSEKLHWKVVFFVMAPLLVFCSMMSSIAVWKANPVFVQYAGIAVVVSIIASFFMGGVNKNKNKNKRIGYD